MHQWACVSVTAPARQPASPKNKNKNKNNLDEMKFWPNGTFSEMVSDISTARK